MAKSDENTTVKCTPMMKQYNEAKKSFPDAILLFRMGDFYEMFYDDARTGARVLNLALTSREKGENAMPMAGFPHQQLEAYVGKLIYSGYRVAVCDQMEDPKQAKGIVKREVTRVVTPGTLTEDFLLNPRESNYLAGLVTDNATVGIAWIDLSTGKFFAAGFPKARIYDQIARIMPSECLICEKEELPDWIMKKMMITRRPEWTTGLSYAMKELTEHFHVLNLDGFGFDLQDPNDKQGVRAAGMILEYLKETQKASLEHIDSLRAYHSGETLEIDESSRRSLEISRTLREGKRDGSLLAALDCAVTSMGSRMLSDWVANPLTNKRLIELRQDAVAELLDDPSLATELRKNLRNTYDLERLLSRVTTGRANPRDLYAIGQTLKMIPEIRTHVSGMKSPLIVRINGEIDTCPELAKTISEAIIENPPLLVTEGGMIRPGYNAELDELREMAHGGRQWISKYQAKIQEESGIQNLKVGYNKVFGFYIEVNHSQKEKVPPYFVRKQTIKNAERYITPDLKEYEELVLSADERQRDLEYRIFSDLRELTLQYRHRMITTANVLAELDVLLAFAELARQRNYCRPEITEGNELEILDGRHPVLDMVTPDGEFVPNDVLCDEKHGKILLITGPNMSGKSTYIRQVALLTLMAQIGCYIPARQAKIGITDRIFTRVGASDELARGQSTFMVEMTETARILNTATSRSLVILDEIGRGTSTYDGISLAWSIIEYLHEKIACRTLFATHYHELTDLAQTFKSIRNLNVAVREWNDEVVFLHKIIEGATDKSYGIHVARLAGVPNEVLTRATEILQQMEERQEELLNVEKIAEMSSENVEDGISENSLKNPSENVLGNPSVNVAEKISGNSSGTTLGVRTPVRPAPARIRSRTQVSDIQFLLFDPKELTESPILAELRKLDVDNLTPIQALTQLAQWKKTLSPEEKKKEK
ncbi:MAG: DNA mismatch repair protein MutS [Planctomycetia bacterium]|nr:DNA mismatch repair protein MutS [Planctomycetia bacterium]